ncbi:MAG: hypothetical protein HY974_02520 [Candidatus Kerfeldbacteria bacterium]|nr:hypothetical protein [Candidatus Kerfeldbacteria bacterium]
MPSKKPLAITQDDKVYAALSYLWALALVPLLFKRDRAFVQFHAHQGFLLFAAEMAIGMVAVVPLLGWLVGFFGSLASVLFSVLGLVAALTGRTWEMPFLGRYAKRFSF